jgi:hypothetical protein
MNTQKASEECGIKIRGAAIFRSIVSKPGAFMQSWYTLEPLLDRLMKESDKLRLGLAARQPST